jgi:hypothetical protein
VTDHEQGIRIARIRANFITRRDCWFCGGLTEKEEAPFAFSHGAELFACEKCAHATPAELRDSMKRRIAMLEDMAGDLRDHMDVTFVVDHQGCEQVIEAGSYCRKDEDPAVPQVRPYVVPDPEGKRL